MGNESSHNLIQIDLMNLKQIFLHLNITMLFFALVTLSIPAHLMAEVTTDGTVGPALSLSGPDYGIPDTLGTTTGDNLFHSFERFSLSMDESATFTGPAHIANVISRVTGGEISSIDGLLNSRVGRADFFFINPAGIVFGPNAKVDVPAAFHVSTADELRFSDDSVFSARAPVASTLSMAAPESFGFISPQPGSITINGSQLEFAPGSSVSMSCGDLEIAGSANDDASLISQSGHIRLAAVGDAISEFPIETGFSGPVNGELQITSAQIDAGGNGGGKISIDAGDMELNEARISNDNTGNRHAEGGTALSASGHVEMENNTSISCNTFGDGEGGSVSISAGKLKMEGGSGEDFAAIYSLTEYGSGDAGNVSVSVQGFLELINGAEISSNTLSDGNAGNVVVTAREIKIDGGGSSKDTGISSSAVYGSGNAGTVQVNARDRLDLINNAIISNDTFTPGKGGPVTVSVEGLMTLTAGAEISGDTFSEGNPGNITITAGNLLIDGGENARSTGISSKSDDYSLADAGTVSVTVEGRLKMRNGAGISSDTYSESNAGKVTVSAREITIDEGGSGEFTGISSSARYGGGSAGTVQVNAINLLEIINDARISSGTYTPGNAGTVTVTVEGLLQMVNGAQISSNTQGEGNAGIVSIMANELRMNGNGRNFTSISSQAFSESQGDAGEVEVNVAGLLELLKGAEISSSTSAEGRGGNVTVNAGKLKIDEGQTGEFTGISSEATYGSGDAGTVEVNVKETAELINAAEISSSTITPGDAGKVRMTVDGLLKMINGAEISSNTSGEGNAGVVTISANELRMNGQGKYVASISSQAFADSQGNAGTVEVNVDGLIELLNGAEIASNTATVGNAGNVTVNAGKLKIDEGQTGEFTGISSEAIYGSGDAGNVEVRVKQEAELINTAMISSSTITPGEAGEVLVAVGGRLEMINGAEITSETSSAGNAGDVNVTAGELILDGGGLDKFTAISSNAYEESGDAGTVTVIVKDLLKMVNGAEIVSDTYSDGDAGKVSVSAGELKIDGKSGLRTGISSEAAYGSGNAGNVNVSVENLMELINGAEISSDTTTAGNAGNVIIKAGNLLIDGEETAISSLAEDNATGFVGNICIMADTVTLASGSQVSIAAYQTLSKDRISEVPPSSIRINAEQLHLSDNCQITAESTANVPASTIQIQVHKILVENESRITTSSNDADGGPISIQGGSIVLRQGLVTTSVEGLSGNGGDITIMGLSPADVLVMQEGFIQANTAAAGASGGNIFIDARAVIAEANRLTVGGQERQIFEPGTGLNVIQAAAPGGEQGMIQITAPDLDITGSLVTLSANFTEPVRLATDPCTAVVGEKASALIFEGCGGIPAGPNEPSTIYFKHERLDQLQQ